MKKFVSTFLIFSTLFSSFAPVHSCFATGKGRCQRPVKRYNVRRCSAPASSLSAKDVGSFKRTAVEAFKDKNFIKELTETADNTMADPWWVKLLKLPFKVIYKLFDYTIGYWIGKTLCTTVEKLIINYVIPVLGACYLYNNSDWFKDHVNSLISYLKLGNQNIKPQEKNG